MVMKSRTRATRFRACMQKWISVMRARANPAGRTWKGNRSKTKQGARRTAFPQFFKSSLFSNNWRRRAFFARHITRQEKGKPRAGFDCLRTFFFASIYVHWACRAPTFRSLSLALPTTKTTKQTNTKKTPKRPVDGKPLVSKNSMLFRSLCLSLLSGQRRWRKVEAFISLSEWYTKRHIRKNTLSAGARRLL